MMDENALVVGRELDVLIAEQVMGLEHRIWIPFGAPEGWYPRSAPRCNDRDPNGHSIDAEGYFSELPYYSTDMSAAWTVVETLTARPHNHYPFTLRADRYGGTYSGGRWLCSFSAKLYEFEEGPCSGDGDAHNYWSDARSSERRIIAAGTASLAICLAALLAIGYVKS